MIEPTVGRIVHYHPGEKAAYPKVHGKPHAAIIADVQSPSVINLTVCAPSGDTYSARGVLLLQDGQTAPAGGAYAEWMPYQKGQAAKIEALQAQIGAVSATTPPAAAPAPGGQPIPAAGVAPPAPPQPAATAAPPAPAAATAPAAPTAAPAPAAASPDPAAPAPAPDAAGAATGGLKITSA